MFSRRRVLSILGAAPAAGPALAGRLYAQAAHRFHHRQLGRTGRWIVPLGLGGQASLERTPEGIDPADIVVRAVELGVNYLDTANAYGPSQANYREAFRRLRLIAGEPGYNAALRERLFIATKTMARYSRDPAGAGAATAVGELERSLTVLFGDGKGFVPQGAYLDSIQVHDLAAPADVDRIYEGFDARGSKMPGRIGALAGLADFRDGTNYTGLNPQGRIRVKHIGLTGHQSSAVLMNAIQRDAAGFIFDTLLVALNACDRRMFPHQNNVLPLAVARGLGVIGMKVFSDGAFYREPGGSQDPVLTVGRDGAIPPADLVRYTVSLPGVATAITGIGSVNREAPERDQLAVNLAAALDDLASEAERARIERDVRARYGAEVNYFQDPDRGLVQPAGVRAERDGDRVRVTWTTAYASAEPILSYVILAGEREVLRLPFRPQTTTEPLSVLVPASEIGDAPVVVLASNLPPWLKTAGGTSPGATALPK